MGNSPRSLMEVEGGGLGGLNGKLPQVVKEEGGGEVWEVWLGNSPRSLREGAACVLLVVLLLRQCCVGDGVGIESDGCSWRGGVE